MQFTFYDLTFQTVEKNILKCEIHTSVKISAKIAWAHLATSKTFSRIPQLHLLIFTLGDHPCADISGKYCARCACLSSRRGRSGALRTVFGEKLSEPTRWAPFYDCFFRLELRDVAWEVDDRELRTYTRKRARVQDFAYDRVRWRDPEGSLHPHPKALHRSDVNKIRRGLL